MTKAIRLRMTLATAGLAAVMTADGAAGASVFEGVELTVLASHVTGDYGTGVDADTQQTLFRLTAGDRFQLRLDVPLLRSRASAGVVAHTRLGPMPLGRGPHGGSSGSTATPGGTGHGMTDGAAGAGDGSASASDWMSGLGDVRVALSSRLLGGGARVHRLDAELEVKVPTAHEGDNLGTGEWDYRLGLQGEYRFWSTTLFGGVGWNALGDPEGLPLEDVLDGWIGVESEPLANRFLISGWIEGNEAVVPGTDARTALGVGFRTTGRLRWRGAVRAGLTDAAEDLSVTVGVSLGVAAPRIGRPLAR